MHTGDVACENETGHYFVVDCRKDLIITAGYNIYPAEIERVLGATPTWPWAVGGVPGAAKGEFAPLHRGNASQYGHRRRSHRLLP